MHERCPVCDLKFDREPGYFLGAMYVSYGLGIVIVALIAALLWSITGWWITKDTIWAVVLFLPFAPTITLFARVLWIYLDQAIDPERAILAHLPLASHPLIFTGRHATCSRDSAFLI